MSEDWFRITLVCPNVPIHLGERAASDITMEFDRRPWHYHVQCLWDGAALVLHAENDWDEDGRALMDEFSDAISGYVAEPFEGDIELRSITREKK